MLGQRDGGYTRRLLSWPWFLKIKESKSMTALHFVKVANSNLDKIRQCMIESDYERFITYVRLLMSQNGGQYYYFCPEMPTLRNSQITPFVPLSEWYIMQKFGVKIPNPDNQWIEVVC